MGLYFDFIPPNWIIDTLAFKMCQLIQSFSLASFEKRLDCGKLNTPGVVDVSPQICLVILISPISSASCSMISTAFNTEAFSPTSFSLELIFVLTFLRLPLRKPISFSSLVFSLFRAPSSACPDVT